MLFGFRMMSDGKKIAFVLLGVLLLASCSLPGLYFSGPVRRPGGRVLPYVIQPVTPKLLTRQAARRQKIAVGEPNPRLTREIRDYAYRVGPHDVLAIVVWGHPEFLATASAVTPTIPTSGRVPSALSLTHTHDFTVHANGDLYFPYVGPVPVAGLTVTAIRRLLAGKLDPLLKDPQVNVQVVGFHSKTYELAGAVVRPGLYPVTDVPLTVSQAIARAGGVLQTGFGILGTNQGTVSRSLADLGRVIFISRGHREILNLRAFYRDGDVAEDRLVRAGDIIRVPSNSFDQVHIIGEVVHPGDYPMYGGHLNLAEALGDAGGLDLTTANPARIFVFRGAYEKPKIYWLNARSPLTMLLANQFALEPQDVIYVATSPVSAWNRIVSQILPTVETLYETKVLTNY